MNTRALNTDPVWIVSYHVTVGPELLKKNQNKTEKHRTIVYKALRELILFCLILRARCLGAGMEGLCFHNTPVQPEAVHGAVCVYA